MFSCEKEERCEGFDVDHGRIPQWKLNLEKRLILLRRYRSDGVDTVSRGAMSRGDTPLGPASALLGQYRGMEGVLVPLPESSLAMDGLGYWASLDELKRYRDSSEDLELICVIRLPLNPPGEVFLPNFTFRGYDCGVFVSSTNIYSVIFHELLFGKLPEIRKYAKKLNYSGLFDEWDDAAFLMGARHQISDYAEGSLEELLPGDNPGVFSVFEATR